MTILQPVAQWRKRFWFPLRTKRAFGTEIFGRSGQPADVDGIKSVIVFIELTAGKGGLEYL